MKNDLSNLKGVAAEMLRRFTEKERGEYKRGNLHLLITLMETARQKKELFLSEIF